MLLYLIMKLSKSSLIFSAYIVISASFMQQVWFALKRAFGLNTLLISFALLCFLIFFVILYKSIKSGLKIKKIILICIIYVSGLAFAWRQPFVPEKAHVLEYGILAWLALRSLSKDTPNILKCIFSTFIFVLVVGSLDEGFQKLLPWRVFELRDIATNVISGILGMLLFVVSAK